MLGINKEVCVHFIGVTPEQYRSAVKVWGIPDFTHPHATWSCLGDIAPNDKVILGQRAFQMPDKWRRKTGGYAHAVPTS